MVIAKQHFRAAHVLVGFVAVLIDNGPKFYSSCKLRASADNTSPVWIGPAQTVTTSGDLEGYRLDPGHDLELEIDNPTLWAISCDLDQQLDLVGL
jgi:hypothetical protein